MLEAVITNVVRTAIGNDGGALKDVPLEHYGAHVIAEVVKRSGVAPKEIEDVIFGNQFMAFGNVARRCLLLAGLPDSVPGITINRACSSGLQAINFAAQSIQLGNGDLYLAGGVESHTRGPYYLERPNTPYQRTPPRFIEGTGGPIGDPALGLGLTMGIAVGENSATEFHISRQEQDEFALLSHQRAIRAIDEGRFREQTVPFPVPQRRGEPIIFDTDEHPRRNTSLERLSRLPPVFKEGGTVTAGNSCGRADAAAAAVVMSREKAERLGLKPFGVVRAHAVAAVPNRITGIAPVPATKKALERAGLRLGDIDLIELNEAFAAQSLAVIHELGLDVEKVNVNGGAVALGHPTGATGCILMAKLLYEMERRQVRYGLVTLCAAPGLGVATIVEREY